MATQNETAAMRRALDAARATVRTLPNPRVGCILLDPDGSPIAIGAHHGAGSPHAEVEALRRAGRRARGATAVVTLEPCNHTGRTGPCAQALLDAGVARVVYAQSDPHPQAAGGAARLAAAGVDVEGGLLASESEALNEEWTYAVAHGRPFVTFKFAATLDGRSAATDGTSQWITSEAARHDVHRLRSTADAVIVGTGTVIADDPHLTVRDEAGRLAGLQPLRVVVGQRAIPAGSRVLDDAAETIVLRTREARAVLDQLATREVRHAWLEGGPTVAGAFVEAGLVDRVVAYVAPALLGDGHAALQTGPTTITGLHRLALRSTDIVGDDLRIIAVPRRKDH